MVIRPDLIGNGRKTIFGEDALESFAKSCMLQKRRPDGLGRLNSSSSIAESIRLKELEAPQREIERQRKEDE
jgi:hypothetical protein